MRKLKSIEFYGEDGFNNIVDSSLDCKTAADMNIELSSYLDFSLKEIKKFTDEFVQKVETQRNYDEKAKKVETNTIKKAGQP